MDTERRHVTLEAQATLVWNCHIYKSTLDSANVLERSPGTVLMAEQSG